MSNKHRHPAILVAHARNGFRRGGHEFGPKPKALALGSLSPAAHAAIVSDQSLVIVPTAIHLEEAALKALPHAQAEHVVQAEKQLDSLPDATSEHAARAASLADIEADLTLREEALAQSKAAFERERAEFGERVAALDERESAFVQSVEQWEADVAAARADQSKEKTSARGARN